MIWRISTHMSQPPCWLPPTRVSVRTRRTLLPLPMIFFFVDGLPPPGRRQRRWQPRPPRGFLVAVVQSLRCCSLWEHENIWEGRCTKVRNSLRNILELAEWMKHKNEWMNEWNTEWMNEWMNETSRMNDTPKENQPVDDLRMNEWHTQNEWMHEWMNEWHTQNEWMNEWHTQNEWMNERMAYRTYIIIIKKPMCITINWRKKTHQGRKKNTFIISRVRGGRHHENNSCFQIFKKKNDLKMTKSD